MRVRDKSNSLCQLPRSGWSVGRAALGAVATYAAEGLGLFTFGLSACGTRMAKNNVLHQ